MPTAPKKAKAQEAPREVIFPKYDAKIYAGDKALTVEQAKKLLGWEEETEENKLKEWTLKDENGTPVVCKNNDHNRPFTESWCRTIAQDILNRHYAPLGPNGETIIIGKTGRVLSGQHRLIALVLANQIWEGPQKFHWEEKWPTAPTMETFVAYGVDESDETTRTLDNVRPRTLSDVLFVGQDYGKYKGKDRKTLCNMMDYAVRLLWHRTGADCDAFAPKRTHSEALDFISRHPRIIRAVKHIFEENKEQIFGTGMKSTIRIGPGYAAGLLYLMGASTSDLDSYRNMDPPGEKKVKWDNWDRAEEFWVELAKGVKGELKPAIHAMAGLANEETGTGGTMAERTAILCKAWNVFAKKQKLRDKDVELERPPDEDGIPQLAECPTVGGIDMGDPKPGDATDVQDPNVEPDAEHNEPQPEPEPEPKGRGKLAKAERASAKKKEEEAKAEAAKAPQASKAAPKPGARATPAAALKDKAAKHNEKVRAAKNGTPVEEPPEEPEEEIPVDEELLDDEGGLDFEDEGEGVDEDELQEAEVE